jgi:D-lactate dehydrogenase
MKVAFFDAHGFERESFTRVNERFGHEIRFFEERLTAATAALAGGCDAACSFVNDRLDATALESLKSLGVRFIALRSAGFNHVDLVAADRLGMPVARVPEYSPYAVAEHAVALALCLNRKLHRAHARVRELNFSLDGLVGFDMRGKAVGAIGTGRIGKALVAIMRGFGCRILLYDRDRDEKYALEAGAQYVSLDRLLADSDIVSLHIPLTAATRHLIDSRSLALMKPSALLINTGRGALIDTRALIEALKAHRIGGAGLDVYEEEESVFFRDHSDEGVDDDLLARLLTFPNVIVTSHQGFLTHEALNNIAEVTLQSLADFAAGRPLSCLCPRP